MGRGRGRENVARKHPLETYPQQVQVSRGPRGFLSVSFSSVLLRKESKQNIEWQANYCPFAEEETIKENLLLLLCFSSFCRCLEQ